MFDGQNLKVIETYYERDWVTYQTQFGSREGVKRKGDKVTLSEDPGMPPGPSRQPGLLGDKGTRQGVF